MASATQHTILPRSLSQAIQVEADATLVTVATQNGPLYSERLWNLERNTIDNFFEKVINALRDDELPQHEFGVQGRVTFYDRANPSEISLEKHGANESILRMRGHSNDWRS
ncbi:hypothetical protein CBS147353_10587 [Aspergillus niger]|nr:hypothetical protein CBS147353_10587 [Aspergillus niger]